MKFYQEAFYVLLSYKTILLWKVTETFWVSDFVSDLEVNEVLLKDQFYDELFKLPGSVTNDVKNEVF